MKSRRDTWLVISLFLILIVVTVLLSIQRSRQAELPAYYSHSNQPNGARALRLWLESQNYVILDDILETEVFIPPQEARLIFILEPEVFSQNDLEALDSWVKTGNILVIAGNNPGSLELASHYEFEPIFYPTPLSKVNQPVPLLLAPPLPADFEIGTKISFSSTRTDYVPYLVAAEAPVMVSFTSGAGKVVLLSSAQPFSNRALKETGNAELILNILNLSPLNSPIWFDEWHHGFRTYQKEIVGPENWLRYTPAGHAIVFSLVVVFLGLLLQGQNFGRPIPILRELRRRAPLEYISAIANLKRRAGHRNDTLAFYHASLKRGLGKRYRLDPSLPDAQYVTQLGTYNPRLDQPALLSILARLSTLSASESELLKLAAETVDWLKDLPTNS
jgi:hypothetical protein